LIINDLVGLRPSDDNILKIAPLIPPEAWEYFCLDGVKYHGRILTILWDRSGKRYEKGKGLTVLADGKTIAQSADLAEIAATLP